MGFFKPSRLELNRRTDTTISVTGVTPLQDLTAITPVAHTLTVQQLLDQFKTSASDGLSKNEAYRRLEQYGENLLDDGDGVSAWKVLVRQLGEHHLFGLVGTQSLCPPSQRLDCRLDWCHGFEFRCQGFRRGWSHRGRHHLEHHVSSLLSNVLNHFLTL